MEEIWNCLNMLGENRFRVRAICDNHPSNVYAYASF